MINIIIVVEHNRVCVCVCADLRFIVLFHPKRQLNLNNNNIFPCLVCDKLEIITKGRVVVSLDMQEKGGQTIIIITKLDTYLELSTRRLFCDMQLTLQSTLPWSLQIVREKRPKFALIILIVSPGSHSIVNVLSSQAYAVPTFGTEKEIKNVCYYLPWKVNYAAYKRKKN